MSFKKAFNIGYVIFLIILVALYFLVPAENMWIAVVILSFLFGLYQLVVGYKLKEK
ncbi:hypothetical protein V1499_11340 [Neobacillus sp. SCS-31]|uniref:hypothetical protein n=1 Tax=Neobacillus oceani TaxID=3115292 RepID=UPI003905CED5